MALEGVALEGVALEGVAAAPGFARLAAGAAALAVLAGCAGMPKHEVNVSPQLRERPVRSVLVLPPSFNKKVKRFTQDDLKEMLPENQAESSGRILAVLDKVMSASLLVESSYRLSDGDAEWAEAICDDLARGRVPLGVEPRPMPAEAVLLLGVFAYGREIDQLRIQLLPFLPWEKVWRIGKEKWEHVCDLQALLVDPREGTVLLDVRHEARLKKAEEDPELTDRVAQEAAWEILNAFPIAPTAPPGESPPAEEPRTQAAPGETAPEENAE